MSRIVVVSYYHAPFPGSGGNRWATIARHLRRAGHDVTVVASDAFGGLPDDGEQGVVRVRDLKSSGPLRGLLGRGELAAPGGAAVEPPPPAVLTKVFVPDAQLLAWVPAVGLALRRLTAAGRVDCLVTTSPPESVHLLGLVLGRRRPAWVADFRDGWNFEPLREPFPTRAQRALDRALERRVARAAEVAVGATRPIADDLERRLGAHAAWIPNGWDPEASPPPGATPPGLDGEQAVTLVHTGTLSGTWGRDPEPLLAALRAVSDDPDVPAMRLILAGRLTHDEEALIARLGLGDAVRAVGVLERSDALALQRAADALVLLTSRNASEATGKVFEYLAAGRPILALAAGNEAARIVETTRTGINVPPDDVDAIAAALRRTARGELAAAYAPVNLDRFFYPGPAETMAGLIDEAIDRRTSQRR